MQKETIGTLQQLFESEFGLDCKEMEVSKPYDVHESNIAVEGFDEKENKIIFAKVLYAIKKKKQPNYIIKLINKDLYEEPMAGKHFIGIYKHESGKVDYTYVSDLQKGMMVVTRNGLVEIEDVKKVDDDFVYDIETETGNFFSGDILSHNTPMSHAITHTGGFALKYAAATSFRTRKIENLTEGSKIVGIHIHCKNYKNKTAVPFRECEMDLYFKDGFDSTCEYVDFLKEFNEDSRLIPLCYAGNGGVFKSEKYGWSFRGKDNFLEAIKKGQIEGWEEIKKTILEIISNEIEGMENTADPEQEFEQNLTEEKADELDQQEIEQ